MARQIAIPGLVRVVTVNRPGEVLELAKEGDLSRGGDYYGPLLNRYILSNIKRALRTGSGPLPSALPRDDEERAAQQHALARRFYPKNIDWGSMPIDLLADYIKGDLRIPIGPLCQQATGRFFYPDFKATPKTWRAAKTIDTAVRSLNPVRHIWYSVGRGLSRAQKTLHESARGDNFCVHATGIAVHTLVRSLTTIRDLLQDQNTSEEMTGKAIIGRAMAAPDSVVRHTTGYVETSFGRIEPGTLVLLQTDHALALSTDPRVAFLSQSWSACPADRAVPALIAEIWFRATGERLQLVPNEERQTP